MNSAKTPYHNNTIKNRMKHTFSTTLIFGLLLTFSACNFLNITPDDRLTQDQVLQQERLINMQLNGIYMNMARRNLYGANLTMSIIECLAQRWSNTNDRLPFFYFSTYNIRGGERIPEGVNTAIWEGLFAQALSVNDFLLTLERTELNIPTHRKNILLGEALGLRAFYHFDILRLWGPVPQRDDDQAFMPYNNSAQGALMPLLSADSIVKKILEDLLEAERLLQPYDPIITQGVVTETQFDPIRDFYTNRNYRMNFYAVKAMQARVYLWIGDRAKAYDAAMEVINSPWFPWVEAATVIGGANPDRVFSTEIIFGIHSRDMYAFYDDFFAPALSETNELTLLQRAGANRLTQTFDLAADIRNEPYLWKLGGGDKTYYVFYKYARPSVRNDPTNSPIRAEFFQPLIRVSEMYYIAAESAPSVREGIELLDQVRTNRALRPFENPEAMTPAQFSAELRKEYEKEFIGEGQLYYFYKRRDITSIPSGIAAGEAPLTERLMIPQTEQQARGTGGTTN
jgi:hypothetical protein